MKLIFEKHDQQYLRDASGFLRTVQNIPGKRMLIESASSDIQLSPAHHTYFARLDTMAGGGGTDKFEKQGLRSLIVESGKLIGAVERMKGAERLAKSSEGFSAEFGPFVEATNTALLELEKQKSDEEFEFGLLRIPSIFVMAVWLKGKTNYFMPIGKCPPPFESYQLYNEKDFLPIVHQLAAEKLRAVKAAGDSDFG